MSMSLDEIGKLVQSDMRALVRDGANREATDSEFRIYLYKEGECFTFDIRQRGTGPYNSLKKEEVEALDVKLRDAAQVHVDQSPPALVIRGPNHPPTDGRTSGRTPPPPPPPPVTTNDAPQPLNSAPPPCDNKHGREEKHREEASEIHWQNPMMMRFMHARRENPGLSIEQIMLAHGKGSLMLYEGREERERANNRSQVLTDWLLYGDALKHCETELGKLDASEQQQTLSQDLRSIKEMQVKQTQGPILAPSRWEKFVLEAIENLIAAEKRRQEDQRALTRLQQDLNAARAALEAERLRIAAAERQANADDVLRRAHRDAVNRNRAKRS